MKFKPPPDRDQRDMIENELERNMLVEAAAGTGKTTSMIGRMIALIRSGRLAQIRHVAAVTFTRKAAAELRARFQVKLEDAARNEKNPAQRRRLAEALENVDRCFIGTIHSFAARILRERPIEAGVKIGFSELDQETDMLMRDEAWQMACERLYADDADGLLAELVRCNLSLDDLRVTFRKFVDYSDIGVWPVPDARECAFDFTRTAAATRAYVAHVAALAPRLPADVEDGKERMFNVLREIPRWIRYYDLDQPAELMEFLKNFKETPPAVSRELSATLNDELKKIDREEKRRWREFHAETVAPALAAWRQLRYAPSIRALERAGRVYHELKELRGLLSFQDLLVKTAALLRDKAHIRKYFRERYTHLLIDEFQDTDPIQAEIMLYLTATDPAETDWRRCRPCPGALFVVGDPKQSIYRFRRADIETYNAVKKIVMEDGAGGIVATLAANFRTTPSLIEWINAEFDAQFGREASDESPAYSPLAAAKAETGAGPLTGIFRLPVPPDCNAKDTAIGYDSEFIARIIDYAVRHRLEIPRSPNEIRRGVGAEAGYSDFMIVTRNTKNLNAYSAALKKRGIPHVVTGGTALNTVAELDLLYLTLSAVHRPDDPVALLGVLRSPIFGIGDDGLYAFKKAGGKFSFEKDVPAAIAHPDGAALRDAVARLRKYSVWSARLPAITAVEKIIADLGLTARAAATEGADMNAGSFAKCVEILRGGRNEVWSMGHFVAHLGKILDREETHDGVSALSVEKPAVRLMNLHKVKGLEAPIVFLADPSGGTPHGVELHVDRGQGATRGYLAVLKDVDGWHKPIEAVPASWEELAEKERRFLDAERKRLDYVAATRAGSATIVSLRTDKRKNENPWQGFEAGLPERTIFDALGVNDLPDEAAPATRVGASIGVDEVRTAATTLEARMRRAAQPTYATSGAKEFALQGDSGTRTPDGAAQPQDEHHGMEFGSLVHELLELAAKTPDCNLTEAAMNRIPDDSPSKERARRAAATAAMVIESEIWKRAARSPARFAEVPFQIPVTDGDVPTIVRGAIDLVFEENGKWVLVDYKTDNVSEATVGEIAAYYAPQMKIYKRAWEEITGEKIGETGFYFTNTGYRVVTV